MIVKVYIKGKFKAFYSGKASGSNAELFRTYQDIKILESWLNEAEVIEAYDKILLTKEPYYSLNEIKNVFTQLKSDNKDEVLFFNDSKKEYTGSGFEKENLFFQEDYNNVVINEIEIIQPATFLKNGEFTGVFYGSFQIFKPDPKPIENIKPNIKNIENQNKPIKIEPDVKPKPIDDVIDPIYTKPWEPYEFLNNFNINRETWDGWKSRWQAQTPKLIFYLIGILFLLGTGFLSMPLMWIFFFYFLIKMSDSVVNIFNPNIQYQLQQGSNLSRSISIFRSLFYIILIFLTIYFYLKKLFLFSAFSFILLILQHFTNKSSSLFLLRRIFQIFGFLLLIFAILRFIDFGGTTTPIPVVKTDDDTEVIPDKPDSIKNINKFTITWKDYQEQVYKGSYGIEKSNFIISSENRNNIGKNNQLSYVYDDCFKFDKTLINGLTKMFSDIRVERKLDAKAFAEMIGCFIQRIPYVLVHDETCESLIKNYPNDNFIQQYHRQGKQCMQNCKFGIQAPTEFGYNLKGDCDTRALLAYTIFNHFGYDVSILTSEVYGHAILGIGLPYNGLYKTYSGIKYFAWELTAKDWQPGMLAPEINNMNNWHVALTNKK